MTVIGLAHEDAAALEAKAQAAGLSLRAWLSRLAAGNEQNQPNAQPVRTAADIPPEIMATMPKDGASQHGHYIYGWPKREV